MRVTKHSKANFTFFFRESHLPEVSSNWNSTRLICKTVLGCFMLLEQKNEHRIHRLLHKSMLLFQNKSVK